MTTPKKDNGPLIRYIGVGVTIFVLIAGMITSWATNNADVAEMKRNHAKLEQRVDGAEDNIHDVQLNAVAESTTLKKVQDDVTEIKKDVKELLKR